MRNIRIRLFLMVALFLSGTVAVSAQERAVDLLQMCATSDGALGLGCAAYLAGFMDALVIQAALSPGSQLACFPTEGISTEQARRVVLKWLEDHPKNLHESRRSQIALALRDAFPCKARMTREQVLADPEFKTLSPEAQRKVLEMIDLK